MSSTAVGTEGRASRSVHTAMNMDTGRSGFLDRVFTESSHCPKRKRSRDGEKHSGRQDRLKREGGSLPQHKKRHLSTSDMA